MQSLQHYNQQFFHFLKASSSPFHVVEEMAVFLKNKGFRQLAENEKWQLTSGDCCYIIRDDAALIAFTIGEAESLQAGFRIIGTHTDSPCLQIKPVAEQSLKSDLLRLGVETYGRALLSTWFDRDLSLAGRIFVLRKGYSSPQKYLIDFASPLLFIPSLAIHLNRTANTAEEINKQNHLCPVIMQSKQRNFSELLLAQLTQQYPEISQEEILLLGYDLFCNDTLSPQLTGANNEFISAGKLDNLLSCFAALQAIGECDSQKNTLLFCANHEENGSVSASGANGNFLQSILERIIPNPENRYRALSNSFLISIDNAHASHPNYPDKMDPNHEIRLNYGPVIKFNANQRYSTNSSSAAVFSTICHNAELKTQKFVMRSDMPCGSTIGPITAAQLGIQTIDIGAPTLGMHSIREHTGYRDPWLCYRALREFYRGNYHL